GAPIKTVGENGKENTRLEPTTASPYYADFLCCGSNINRRACCCRGRGRAPRAQCKSGECQQGTDRAKGKCQHKVGIKNAGFGGRGFHDLSPSLAYCPKCGARLRGNVEIMITARKSLS